MSGEEQTPPAHARPEWQSELRVHGALTPLDVVSTPQPPGSRRPASATVASMSAWRITRQA